MANYGRKSSIWLRGNPFTLAYAYAYESEERRGPLEQQAVFEVLKVLQEDIRTIDILPA